MYWRRPFAVCFSYIRRDPYQVLQVDPQASQEQIKKSYLELSKRYHPDTNAGGDETLYRQIREAYDILKDSNSRFAHDQAKTAEQEDPQPNQSYTRQEESIPRSNRNKAGSTLFLFSMVSMATFLAYQILSMPRKTEHEIRRGNIFLANEKIDSSPTVIQRRKKQYAQEIKDKRITSRVVQLKVYNGTPETEQTRRNRLQGLISLGGIQKETIGVCEEESKAEYM